MTHNPQELVLSVVNASALRLGTQSQFTCRSDVHIGAAFDADWCLNDREHSIQPQHCEIRRIDDRWCIIDLCAGIYLNGASAPMGRGERAQLKVNDDIRLGELTVRVGHRPLQQEAPESVDTLVGAISPHEDIREVKPQDKTYPDDPLLGLDVLLIKQHPSSQAPDALLYDSTYAPEMPDLNFTPESDSEFEMSSSIALKTPRQMSNHPSTLTAMETPMDNTSQPTGDLLWDAEPQDTHLLTGPMLSGLGATLAERRDVTQLHHLSNEIGQSLQACIQGLLAVHQQVRDGRLGTLNRNLQPIEDNPLRLGLSYQDTITTMFDDGKSAVHLAPPSAISESLKQVRDHHDAMLHATSVALTHILEAFSPEVLLRRFSQYQRGQSDTLTDNGHWAWQMYSNYYQELTSSRQQGFEKLYWEIFEQAYDRRIRDIQRES